MIAARANSLPRPIKWFSVPRLCRAERPQRGRLREFFQWNIDVVGVDDVLADAECIFVALDFFREVGLTPDDVVMKVNSRSLLSAVLEARGIERDRHDAIFVVLDKRDKLPEEAFVKAVETIASKGDEKTSLLMIGQATGAKGLASMEELAADNKAAQAELTRLKELFELLAKMGVADYCTFDMGVVRGLAYYTGIVFEGFSTGGLRRAICGGGRYDQLLEVLGGPPMSGVGFGTSDVVIQDVLEELDRLPAEAYASGQVDFFLIDADTTLFGKVLELTASLRHQGVSAAFSYRRQAVGKQLKQASGNGARFAVIVGAELTERGVVSVKNLGTGKQVEMDVKTFLANPARVE
jgi:histidyl-tRNA synthetase